MNIDCSKKEKHSVTVGAVTKCRLGHAIMPHKFQYHNSISFPGLQLADLTKSQKNFILGLLD